MVNTKSGYEGKDRFSNTYETGGIERASSAKAHPYVVVVTTALVTLLVSVLGWMLLELREVRVLKESTSLAIERTRTSEARAKDLENQITALRREQDLQNKMIRQQGDWQSLRLLK